MTYAQYSRIVHTVNVAIQEKVHQMTMLQTTRDERITLVHEVTDLSMALIGFSHLFTQHNKEA